MSEVTSVAARALLEAERDSLRAELADLGGLDYDANFADTSQVTAERGETEALASTLQESLDEVERALAKLEDGSYGKCEVCGEDIAAARLEAMPAARYCITHASTRR
ncbi:MAG TPA: TraR/DksA C4-type zinc finger protein [Acidimicrobiales bacterium]|nr:TraR/DksA C4-type zinc finger protein [Acidimicrobiales bacterium]HVV35557.1 TraR/DksA C4-type zinc finger protein [Acidimicrobiales bacterium]